ncbi:MAG: DUF1080 domain-containing protein [Armatimonadota bacterium]|nr:DUF1080 domain-containing protein [Armatimonadota bacterium]
MIEEMRSGPYEVATLFDGSSLEHWSHADGSPAGWVLDEDEGCMTVAPRAGNILSDERHEDCFLHLEFRCPDMPEAEGQHKGNSGVYLQGRYEIQVLDSYGWETPGLGDCGAIYNQHAPLVNACRPPEQWQSYDVIFRAPRLDEQGQIVECARMTLLLNGLVIHNNIVLTGPTGGHLDENIGEPGVVMLQDHGDVVSYRNIWLVHLPAQGAQQYEPA